MSAQTSPAPGAVPPNDPLLQARGERRPVAGTVTLMTDEPLEIAGPDADPGRGGLARIVDSRPWLIPATILTILGLLLIGRRR